MSRLTDALDERFNDIEECKEIAEHGCASCAPHQFIYYYETRKFFFEHEDELEQYVEDNYGWDLFRTRKFGSVNQLINDIVWFVIETHCRHKYDVHLGGFEHDGEFYPVTA